MTVTKSPIAFILVWLICMKSCALGNNIKFSKPMSQLFESTLWGCSTRTLLEPTSVRAKTIFENIVTWRVNGMIIPRTYIIDQLFSHGIMLPMDSYFKQAIYPANYTKPIRLLQKYNLCYIHLYLIDTEKQYATALTYHFIDLDLRRERPKFVIFWDLCEVKLNLRVYSGLRTFSAIFSDYRIYIRFDPEKQGFNVSLLCVICWHTSSNKTVEVPLLNSTETFIHNLWKTLHTNHKNIRRLTCHTCLQLLPKYNEGKDPIYDVIAKIFNVTLKHGYWFYYQNNGYMSGNDIYFTPYKIEQMFLARRSPSYTIIPSFLKTFDYKLVTVVLKSTMTRLGWTAIFSPFHKSLWITLLFMACLIATILNKIRPDNNKRYVLTGIIFELFRAVTGQCYSLAHKGHRGVILHLWFGLCYYLTMFYGGDLVASISTLLIPPYPQNIDELGVVPSNLVSTTVYLFEDGGVWTKRLLGWSKGETNRSFSIIQQLNRFHCHNDRWEINVSKRYDPLRCQADTDTSRIMYDAALKSPLTFIENEYRLSSVRMAFQSSSLFWVSPTSHLPDGQQLFPMVTSANYFGKLLHPIFSAWYALGLESHWFKLRQRGKQKKRFFRNQRVPRLDVPSSSSSDFHPMKIGSLNSIIAVIYLLAGIATGVWLVELLVHHFKICFQQFVS